MKKHILLMCVPLLTACRISVGNLAPLTVINGLGGWTIHYVQASRADTKGWGDDLLGPSEIIRPGANRVFSLPPGTWDIRITDDEGDTYTRRDIVIPAEGYTWEVTLNDIDSGFPDMTGNCPVTFLNSLDTQADSIWISPSDYGYWGTSHTGGQSLQPGGELVVWVAPGGYDMMASDGMGNSYAVYNCRVTESGFFWEITEDYLERQR